MNLNAWLINLVLNYIREALNIICEKRTNDYYLKTTLFHTFFDVKYLIFLSISIVIKNYSQFKIDNFH